MYIQSPLQLIWMFQVFCIIGWVWETIYESTKNKKLLNRGMLRGPYIPIYGFSGIIIALVCSPLRGPLFSTNSLILFLGGFFGISALEYITATIIENKFHKRLWDYSDYPFNYKGRIGLISAVFWGLVTIFATDFLVPFVTDAYMSQPTDRSLIFATSCATAMVIDLAFKVKEIMHINVKESIANSERLEKFPRIQNFLKD